MVSVLLQNPKSKQWQQSPSKGLEAKDHPMSGQPMSYPQEATSFGQCGFWPQRKGGKETRESKWKHGIWHVCAHVCVKERASSPLLSWARSHAGAKEHSWAALVPAHGGQTHARLAVDITLTVVSDCRHVWEFLFQRFHSCVFTARSEWGEGSCAMDKEWEGAR